MSISYSINSLNRLSRFSLAFAFALIISAVTAIAQEDPHPSPTPAPSPAEQRRADDETQPVAEPSPAPTPAQDESRPSPAPSPEPTPAPPAAAAGAVSPATPAGAPTSSAAEPVYREYKGVRLGMTAAEVRQRLGSPEESSEREDFFIFSDHERARVLYGSDGKVMTIVATYIGARSNAPAPRAILGAEIEANQDGSMYRMERYPAAGYWVSYSRTAGDAPLVIVTMQRMQQMGTATP